LEEKRMEGTDINRLLFEKDELIRKLDTHQYKSIDEKEDDIFKLNNIRNVIDQHNKNLLQTKDRTKDFQKNTDVSDKKAVLGSVLTGDDSLDSVKDLSYTGLRYVLNKKYETYQQRAKQCLKEYYENVKKKKQGKEILYSFVGKKKADKPTEEDIKKVQEY
jgi:hypothetical protein